MTASSVGKRVLVASERVTSVDLFAESSFNAIAAALVAMSAVLVAMSDVLVAMSDVFVAISAVLVAMSDVFVAISAVFVAMFAVFVAMSDVFVAISAVFVAMSAVFVAMLAVFAAISALSSRADRSAEKLVAPSVTVTSLVPPLNDTPVMSSSEIDELSINTHEDVPAFHCS